MTNWIDKLLSIGSTPDWISPLVGLVEAETRSSVYIRFSRYSCSVNTAKRMLNKAGIETWNEFVDGDTGVLCVSPEDEENARQILSI